MDLRPFERKTFRVEALQVTAGNIREVAEWCNAQYKTPDSGKPYLIVPSGTRGNCARARIGDWITRLTDANNFRVYQNHVFREAFTELPNDEERFAIAVQYVKSAMNVQDSATYHGDSLNVGDIAETVAKKILALV